MASGKEKGMTTLGSGGGGESESTGRGKGAEKEVRKCPRENVDGERALPRYGSRKARGAFGAAPVSVDAEEKGGGEGRMLFRTAKLNYQIKQQRRYINKIDFARARAPPPFKEVGASSSSPRDPTPPTPSFLPHGFVFAS